MVSLLILMFFLPALLVAKEPPEPTVEEMIEAWVNLVEPAKSKCACESGASLGDITTLWDTFHYPKDNPCLMCYMKCIYIEIGLSDSNYNPIQDVYVSLVLGVTDEIFVTCEDETSHITDLCRKLYDFDECISREMGLL